MVEISNKPECAGCGESSRCKSEKSAAVFFVIGLISTVAIRVVAVLSNFNAVYGKIAWYVGVLGFLIFFLNKYRVEQGRYRLIRDMGLMEKVSKGGQLAENERQVISEVLCALSSNKDRINYFFIFISSAIVLIVAIYFDLFKR